MTARIVASASYVPERVLTNEDLEKLVDTSDEWITTRTGIRERRIAAEDEHASDMGVAAAERLLKESGTSAEEIDLVLVATMTPDYLFPSTAALIQDRIGASRAAAFDFQAACSGYLYGLSIAKAYVESGMYKSVLFIATEKLSAFVDYEDRNTCVIFGDGASAALIRNEGVGLALSSVVLGADGAQSDLLMVPAGGSRNPASATTVAQRQHFLNMNGKETFKHAVRRMSEAIKTCMHENELEGSDISWLVPHQANERIIDSLAKKLSLPKEQVYKTIHKYGNTSASSVGIALDELMREKDIHDGENILLVAFGAGLTWGASVVQKVGE
jgi:3-oxoacyl-[acyl-carrier-protein] synthase III